jgi:rubrerythrin
MSDSENRKLLAALKANWQAEMQGNHTYLAFAEKEADPQRRNALRGLAAAEKLHADMWAGRIQDLGGAIPEYDGRPSGEPDTLANRVGGINLALRRLEIDEARDVAKYGNQIKSLGDEQSVSILQQVIADEREHYKTLGNLIRSRRQAIEGSVEQLRQLRERRWNEADLLAVHRRAALRIASRY